MKFVNLLKNLAQAIGVEPGDLHLPTSSNSDAGLANIISWVFVILGFAAMVVMILSGINYMTSQGEPEKIKKARDRIIYAGIGIIVAAAAFAITRLFASWF